MGARGCKCMTSQEVSGVQQFGPTPVTTFDAPSKPTIAELPATRLNIRICLRVHDPKQFLHACAKFAQLPIADSQVRNPVFWLTGTEGQLQADFASAGVFFCRCLPLQFEAATVRRVEVVGDRKEGEKLQKALNDIEVMHWDDVIESYYSNSDLSFSQLTEREFPLGVVCSWKVNDASKFAFACDKLVSETSTADGVKLRGVMVSAVSAVFKLEFSSAKTFESLFSSNVSAFQLGTCFAELSSLEFAGNDDEFELLRSNFGAYPVEFKTKAEKVDAPNFTLIAKRQLSPNSWALRFGLPFGERLTNHPTGPTGVKLVKPGATTEKSYSPMSNPTDNGSFDLLVKKYPFVEGENHGFGAFLCDMTPGDIAQMKVKGTKFGKMTGGRLERNKYQHIGLLAAGTGLAPLFQVMVQILDDHEDSTKLSLIFANRHEEDILLREQIDALAKKHAGRVNVFYTLSQPSENWTGGKGHVNTEMCREHLPTPGLGKMVLVCGTDAFVATCGGKIKKDEAGNKVQGPLSGILKELGFEASMVHKF